MEHTVAHGAPPHPLHETRGTVRTGQVGAAAFTVGSKPSERFSHFFETSVGSGHMSLTLREDWRNHIRMAARDLGVKHIRGHGLLDDDMSVSFAYGKHAFYNIDSLVDVLSSVGMRPIFELSFMPDWLTNGTDTVSSLSDCSLSDCSLSACSLSACSLTSAHLGSLRSATTRETRIHPRTIRNGGSSSAPWGSTWWTSTASRSQARCFSRCGTSRTTTFGATFRSLCTSNSRVHTSCVLVETFIFLCTTNDSFMVRTFGVYRKGGQEGYWELYTQAARALKAASPALKVGGPATCCADCWIDDFVKYMDSHNVPYDFISTHAYSSCQMAGLGDVERVVKDIQTARADLDNVTATNHPNHPAGKTPPWLITEFGSSCNQGFGDPGANQFPAAIHDMIDQSSYTIATVDKLAGAGEPQALSYWAVSDVFEESFFPVHNESFHGMFGLINLHGVPKPTYRAYLLRIMISCVKHTDRDLHTNSTYEYHICINRSRYQLLHETGDTRLPVAGPVPPPVPTPQGTCGAPVEGEDVWGGDVAPVATPCPTCGLFTLADCCDLCLRQNKPGAVCDIADLWHEPGQDRGNKCGLKSFAQKVNVTKNPMRTYVPVKHAPSPPPSNEYLCAVNTGVLAVQNGSSWVDLLLYNHASFADPIVDCNITVTLPAALAGQLSKATVRRIDETHSNPLAAWIAMGAPDYTTAAQNAALLAASELVTEELASIAKVQKSGFEMLVPTHGVAAVRVTL